MALIPTFSLGISGAYPTMNAAAAGDTAPVGDRLYLLVENTNAATRDITFATPGNLVTGDAFPDKAYTVAALTGRLVIPLLPVYADPADGLAHITYSATTNVTRAVIQT